MPLSDRELFARLIRCEAEGEGLEGQRGVATVVMNRVHVCCGEYARVNKGRLRNVILQDRQFTCTLTTVYGQPNPQNIYSMTPRAVDYQTADWALSGNQIPGLELALWYFNPYSPDCQTYFPVNKSGVYQLRIAQHCFYNPTPKYYET